MAGIVNIDANYTFKRKIIKDGLVYYLDAAMLESYPGTGNVWYDLSNNKLDASLNNIKYKKGTMLTDQTGESNSNAGPLTNILYSNVFTFSVWFKMTIPTPTYSRILTFFKSYLGGYPVMLFLWPSGASWRLLWYESGQPIYEGYLSSNIWYNIVVIRDLASSKIIFYRNGTFSSSNDWSNFYTYTIDTIRLSNYSSEPFYGQISNAMIYNRALSESEIQINYNALKNRFGTFGL